MKILVGVCLLSIAASIQLVPLTVPKDGYTIGPAVSNYTIDVFYDHLCIDSKNSYPGLMSYWKNNSDWLQINFHIFPLPYHTYSFEVSIAGRYIQKYYPQRFLDFMAYMFNHQKEFLDTAMQWTWSTVQTHVAQYAAQATGVSYSEIFDALEDPEINMDVRKSWKYSTSKLNTGTPRFFFNGVWAHEATSYTRMENWQEFFQQFK